MSTAASRIACAGFHLARRWHPLALVLLLGLGAGLSVPFHAPPSVSAQPSPPVETPSPSEPWETRFLHRFHTTLQLPASWRFYDRSQSFYDVEGHRRLAVGSPYNAPGEPLEALCEWAATRTDPADALEYLRVDTGQGCVIHWFERPVGQVLIRLPEPYTSAMDGPVDTLWWYGYRDMLPRILETVSFDPPSPALYLGEALRILEENYIFADDVDWPAVREEALTMLDAGSTYADAHVALAHVFDRYLVPLDNGHSSFYPPEYTRPGMEGKSIGRGYAWITLAPDERRLITLVYPGGAAERAGLRPGDVLLTAQGQSFADYQRALAADPTMPVPEVLTHEVLRPGARAPIALDVGSGIFDVTLPVTGRRLDGDIAYIETYSISWLPNAETIAYGTAAHATLAALDTPPACGWIVDLRRNAGGDMPPMALAAAPLWGEGDFLRRRAVRGPLPTWRYESGTLIDDDSSSGDEIGVQDPHILSNPQAPMAVLLSQTTASMGELTARQLLHRPGAVTRTFGETTRGWGGTFLDYFQLYDFAEMDFADSVVVDAQGNPVTGRIVPDVPMAPDYAVFGSDQDPMIQAAAAWLLTQDACAGVPDTRP